MMKKGSGGIAETVRTICEPVAETFGLELWDVEYVKEGSRMILRLTIDKPDGVTIDDCEAFHRAIDPLLDEADPIENAYYLEVSSPGLERELRTDAHILACTDWDVEVRLFAPVDGSKVYRGVLRGFSDEGHAELVLGMKDGSERRFAKNAVAKVMTVYDFGD